MSGEPYFVNRKTVEANAEIADPIRNIVGQIIREHTIPDSPVYFFEGQWLVTYKWHAELARNMGDKVAELERRLARLERPWWRRWLNH